MSEAANSDVAAASGPHVLADPANEHLLPEDDRGPTDVERDELQRNLLGNYAEDRNVLAAYRSGWDRGVTDLDAVRPSLTAPDALDRAARALSMDDGNDPDGFGAESSARRQDTVGRALLILEAAMGAVTLDEIAVRHGYRPAAGKVR